MRILYLSDRISDYGGADLHLRAIVEASSQHHQVIWAHGGRHRGCRAPANVQAVRLRALASADDDLRLERLNELVDQVELVHVQNVMNPAVLRLVVERRPCVVTIQDHRLFCPGRGKWKGDGSVCHEPMSTTRCRGCVSDDRHYESRRIALTNARREAIAAAQHIVLSRYMADELAAVGLDAAEVIPPWFDASAEHIAGDYLLAAGRFVAHKGLDQAIAAWRNGRRSLPLLLAGSGPTLPPPGDGVKTLGWVSQTKLRELLRRARALIFPSVWQEPFGMLGPEALAVGTPVIVMESGGTRDWSQLGCITVQRDDRTALCAAIDTLSRDPRTASELGCAGQQAIARRFSRRALWARLEQVYRRVASR